MPSQEDGRHMLISSGKPDGPQVLHMSDMPAAERTRRFGSVDVEWPSSVVAGECVRVAFTYTAGTEELPAGGRLRIAWRWPFDWSHLQSGESADGVSIAAVGRSSGRDVEDVSVDVVFAARGDFDPWNHHIELTVAKGRICEGERIELVCGGEEGGWRAPTFSCRARFLVAVNPGGGNEWWRLDDPPAIHVVPGVAERLVVMAPTDVTVGEPFDVHVRAEDRWGNPTELAGGAPGLWLTTADAVESSGAGPATQADQTRGELIDDPPIYRFNVTVGQAGTFLPSASAASSDLKARGNPVRVCAQRPRRRIFWGDLHSGQTEIGCGAGSLAEHFRFARYAAGLQFATQQSNDHYITVGDWVQIQQDTEAADEEGEFVTFLGCEWSLPTVDGGDRNVIYRQSNPSLRRSGRFFVESVPDPEPDLPRAPEFLAAMEGEEVLLNLHVGGRPTNLDFHLPPIEPLFEIHSTHGTSEWFVKDALSRGYRVGITAGTDGVVGRPGADHPGWRQNRNLRSGLTAVYAEELSRDALWEAFAARRCYATTGERIILHVDVDGHGMGEEYKTSQPPQIHISAIGTASIERVDLLRGTTVVKSWAIAAPAARAIRILWRGTQERGTAGAQRVTWDGSLKVTGGAVGSVRALGFQSPNDAVWQEETGVVTWRSVTAGNRAGLVMEVEGDERTTCSFSSGPCSFEFEPGRVREDPLTVDAGGEGRRVDVGAAPAEDGTRVVDGLVYGDEEDFRGPAAYWVRLVQVDQAMAWSSPVYVDRIRDAGE